jgi:hypothetical protein
VEGDHLVYDLSVHVGSRTRDKGHRGCHWEILLTFVSSESGGAEPESMSDMTPLYFAIAI